MGENQVQRNSSFRFEIDNFSEKEGAISSQAFMSNGCEWYLTVHPKGDRLCDDQLGLFLYVANPESLGSGWKRKPRFQFVLLNQSDKEFYRSPSKGYRNTFPLTKLQEKGFLEKDRLIVEVYISQVEVVDGKGRLASDKKETLDINGSQVLASQAASARKIFTEHPDIEDDFKPENQVVKTEYMTVLLKLIETLNKPSQNHSETELNNAHIELSELMEQGFKLDWLQSKLDELSLQRKKADADVNNLEMRRFEFKLACLELKIEEGKKSRVQELLTELKQKLKDLREAKSFADDFRNSSFSFKINNFSEKEAAIASQSFLSYGYEWFLYVHPKGDDLCDDHMSVFLHVANPKSLGSGWKRKSCFQFVLLNQFGKELYRSPNSHGWFSAEATGWGFRKTLPLDKLHEKGFLKKDKLIVEVYITSVEADDGKGRVVSEKKETLDINGFQVFASQAASARKIFTEHPDFADDFKPKNQVVKTEYMNVLLNLIETLNKPSQNHSETELSNAHMELSELMEQGFKLDWLQSKLDEVSLQRKKADADVTSARKIFAEHPEIAKDFKPKNQFVKKEYMNVLLNLVETLSKPSQNHSNIEIRSARSKLSELMEQGFKLDWLKLKLEKVSLERKKPDDAHGSRVKEMEGRIKSLEKMVLDLKVELGKENKGQIFY
ncbi:hypothetical protein CARUB_v10025690mg [Capsella rubella]|uniref:MATH domain-containing protein n=1 Tax=Capsella rubella TaxID=81985 RepID=R0G276_9BRAS|nr:hypothetical protein CARUB_v10025690mg [Capsella rubella]